MFKKLLANLAFNPSLINQVVFYSKKLNQEARLRRLGFMAVCLALGVQVVAALYPAQNSLAAQSQANFSDSKKYDQAGLKLSKAVVNTTQKTLDANNTKAKKADILEFRLTTENRAARDYANFQGEDYFGRVLQYATLVDPGGLKVQGLRLDQNNYLRWSVPVLKAGASDVKTVRVQVKSVIPSTNKPSADSPDYNCTISNHYGNLVVVNVPCPIVKVLAESAGSLPKSSASTSLAIGFGLAGLVGFLFARSRLLADELEAVRRHYITSGGA